MSIQLDPQAQKLVDSLQVDLSVGLSPEQVQLHRQRYGSNELSPAEKAPLWKRYLEKFEDPTILILGACALLAIATGVYRGVSSGEWLGIYEAAAILVAILIATGVGFVLELKADKAFELLKQESENAQVKVTRGGRFQTVRVNDLVVGDIVHLEQGDQVPADGYLLASSEFSVDQSAWTGESEPVEKSPTSSPFLAGMSGVVEGNAQALISAVGDASERGKLARRLQGHEDEEEGDDVPVKERRKTPLEVKLGDLADLINILGTAAAALIFCSIFGAGLLAGELGGTLSPLGRTVYFAVAPAVLAATLGLLWTKKGHSSPVRVIILGWISAILLGTAILFLWGQPLSGLHGPVQAALDNLFSPLLRYFMLAVTIIVVAVPEGLPMAIMISLALSMRKIRKDNNLVRKMIATETLGSTNVICSDKTGTLTLNRMTVGGLWTRYQLFEADDTATWSALGSHPAMARISEVAILNSTAHLEQTEGGLKYVGNYTECALLKWLMDLGIPYETLRETTEILRTIGFSSERKMMTRIVSLHGDRLVLVKGAPERIMAKCSWVEGPEGTLLPMEGARASLESQIDAFARKAMRTLALAYRQGEDGEDPESGLVFLALVGINDPVRPDVPEAVGVCHKAGIDVKMVTGDHEVTARVIAEKIGIWKADSILLSGEQFDRMGDEEIRELLARIKVLARFTPLQKERLVHLVQSTGAVVAVTGDGTNDAPALRAADVGISMGMRGTDIAKAASDIVLVDDNFGSIVRAVHWGRALYENVQKFIQFQLTINLSALVIAFVCPLLAIAVSFLRARGYDPLPHAAFKELPLTILQLLWINLIMDTLAALALSLEPKRDEQMSEPPKRRDESIITRHMVGSILTMSAFFILVSLSMQASGWYLGADPQDPGQVRSVIFTSYVFMQVFNLFNARSVHPGRSVFAGIGQSTNFWIVMLAIAFIQVGLTEFGGKAFATAPLPLGVWVNILGLGICTLAVGAVYRLFMRRLVSGTLSAPVPQALNG